MIRITKFIEAITFSQPAIASTWFENCISSFIKLYFENNAFPLVLQLNQLVLHTSTFSIFLCTHKWRALLKRDNMQYNSNKLITTHKLIATDCNKINSLNVKSTKNVKTKKLWVREICDDQY